MVLSNSIHINQVHVLHVELGTEVKTATLCNTFIPQIKGIHRISYIAISYSTLYQGSIMYDISLEGVTRQTTCAHVTTMY